MTYPADAHEEGLAAFIRPMRRERFVAALRHGGRARVKELARLHDSLDLDERWVRPLPTGGRGEVAGPVLLTALDELAPGAVGYLVSGDPELDGRLLGPAEALEAAAWTDQGVLISVVPGRVAVYVGELADSVRLLTR